MEVSGILIPDALAFHYKEFIPDIRTKLNSILNKKTTKSELFYRTVNQNMFSHLFLRNINIHTYHITAPYVWLVKNRYQKLLKLNFCHN